MYKCNPVKMRNCVRIQSSKYTQQIDFKLLFSICLYYYKLYYLLNDVLYYIYRFTVLDNL